MSDINDGMNIRQNVRGRRKGKRNTEEDSAWRREENESIETQQGNKGDEWKQRIYSNVALGNPGGREVLED